MIHDALSNQQITEEDVANIHRDVAEFAGARVDLEDQSIVVDPQARRVATNSTISSSPIRQIAQRSGNNNGN